MSLRTTPLVQSIAYCLTALALILALSFSTVWLSRTILAQAISDSAVQFVVLISAVLTAGFFYAALKRIRLLSLPRLQKVSGLSSVLVSAGLMIVFLVVWTVLRLVVDGVALYGAGIVLTACLLLVESVLKYAG